MSDDQTVRDTRKERTSVEVIRTVAAVLISLIGVWAAIATEAQPAAKTFRVGLLTPIPATESGQTSPLVVALIDGLRELGYVEGRNLVLEQRHAASRPEQLPERAAELVRARMDLIVAVGSQASLAAKATTASVPIVMIGVAGPVEIGLVANLARPGGNVTGLAFTTGQQIYAKHLELLKEIVPKVSRVAVVIDPRSPTYEVNRRELDVAARALGLTLLVHEVRSPADLAHAFGVMPGQRAGAVFVVPNPFVYGQRQLILELAARHRVPGVHGFREFVDDGGLLYYGTDLPAMWRRAATFVDKILKGARPADLPVEQPSKFELVVNLRTARGLGLTVPPALLSRADHVID
jgi:putative ABC transport system substrate-binding protein